MRQRCLRWTVKDKERVHFHYNGLSRRLTHKCAHTRTQITHSNEVRRNNNVGSPQLKQTYHSIPFIAVNHADCSYSDSYSLDLIVALAE